MKAFLLAAGLGTRLRPLTSRTPKCLISINGVPLLSIWLDLLSKHGVAEVILNTHYLADQVHNYIAKHNDMGKKPYIWEFYEKKLLGSGGTVLKNQEFIASEKDFLICYADNLTNINLSKFIMAHRNYRGLFTMALFRAPHPEQCGIAELNREGRIVSFTEKPKSPKSKLANAGVYVATPQIFKYFPEQNVIDFGKDVLPKMIGKMYGYEIHDYLLDIGTPETYKQGQEEWAEIG